MVEFRSIDISLLDPNEGQIAGVPRNPRKWARRELENLARSMEETPELTEARGAIVYPQEGRYVVLGGNMRLAAARKHLGWTELMCAVLPADTTVDRMRQIVQKDNSSFGAFDYDILRSDWMGFGYDYASWGLNLDTQEIELEPKEAVNFIQAYQDAGFLYKQELIWVKNGIVLGRSDYQWQHEPCLYGWKEGAAHYFTDDRTLRTVVDEWPDFDKMDKASLRDFCKRVFDRDAVATDIIREDKPLRNAEHPTMKPIPLMGRFVRNSTRRGATVIDLFGGSGSTLMACEQLDRTCRTMEYDPKYCDVIIQRWEKFTGRKAAKIKAV